MKPAIVISHPTQYYSPWFRYLAKNAGLDLTVYYLWDFGVKETHDRQFGNNLTWDVDLLFGYRSVFLSNQSPSPGTHHIFGLINPAIIRRLSAGNHDAVLVFGYKYVSHLLAVLSCRLRKTPLLFRGDSHLLGRKDGAIRFIPRLLLKTLFSRFNAFLPVGQANRKYLLHCGASEHSMFFCPHAIDTERFLAQRKEAETAAADLRRQCGIDRHQKVVLFAGKFIEKKMPLLLAEAFLEAKVDDIHLVFVGDGEQKPRLAHIAKKAPKRYIHLLPFANQSEMPARYLMADLFVLPSFGPDETWGLAVQEAMTMGVPCLVSNHVGCQQDLVEDGITGWVFEAGNKTSLVAKLREALFVSPAKRESMKTAIKDRLQNYSYERATQGLLKALDYIRSRKR